MYCLVRMLAVALLGIALIASGGEEARVLDGAGGWSSNAVDRTVTAACQPNPVGTIASAAYICHSGFLNSFLLHPEIDTDEDGLPDENDVDDDNDTLSDALELSGAAFDPPTASDPLRADTDDDGMTDAIEAASGTNPHDAGSLLRITGLSLGGGAVRLAWQSRAGHAYEVVGADTISALSTSDNVLQTVTAVGGQSPWFETVSTGTVSGVQAPLFLQIRLQDVE